MNRQSYNRIRRRVRSAILVPIFRFSIAVCGWVPRWCSHLFFSSMGGIGYYVVGRDRRRTITHLTQAFGDRYSPRQIRSMARQVFRNLGHSFADFMIGQSVKTVEDLEEILSVEGGEHLENAYKKGKGVVVVIGHLSCFELIAPYSSLRYPTFIVGARLDDERMDAMLVKTRERHGATNIYKGEANLKLFRALKQGGVLGLLIDQDIAVKSAFVDFFGRPAATPIGPALLVQRTGAACLCAAVQRIGSKQHLTFTPEIEFTRTEDPEADLVTNTARFSKIIEGFIRETPTQWVWMHRRWRTRPEDEESRN